MFVYMFLILWFVSCSDLTLGRRYDVEFEAIKLFGEPLVAVIARLRRTPEYLDILTDRLDELKKEKENFSIHLLEIYRVKLIEKLGKIFYTNSTEPSPMGLRTLSWPSRIHRRQSADIDLNFTNYVENAVYRLDNHPILHHDLSVEERNRYKDMGFEFAGDIIHNLISSMEPSDAPYPSTQQPWGDSDHNRNFTTIHSHLVTQPSPITLYLNELNNTKGIMTPPAKYYRQRQKLF